MLLSSLHSHESFCFWYHPTDKKSMIPGLGSAQERAANITQFPGLIEWFLNVRLTAAGVHKAFVAWSVVVPGDRTRQVEGNWKKITRRLITQYMGLFPSPIAIVDSGLEGC